MSEMVRKMIISDYERLKDNHSLDKHLVQNESIDLNSLPPFILTLYTMLVESVEYIRWNSSGTAFEIPDVERLSTDVLPKYFKHENYSSFQRQLNYFGFRKSKKTTSTVCTFSNPHFTRQHPGLCMLIKRKKSKKETMLHDVEESKMVVDSGIPHGSENAGGILNCKYDKSSSTIQRSKSTSAIQQFSPTMKQYSTTMNQFSSTMERYSSTMQPLNATKIQPSNVNTSGLQNLSSFQPPRLTIPSENFHMAPMSEMNKSVSRNVSPVNGSVRRIISPVSGGMNVSDGNGGTSISPANGALTVTEDLAMELGLSNGKNMKSSASVRGWSSTKVAPCSRVKMSRSLDSSLDSNSRMGLLPRRRMSSSMSTDLESSLDLPESLHASMQLEEEVGLDSPSNLNSSLNAEISNLKTRSSEGFTPKYSDLVGMEIQEKGNKMQKARKRRFQDAPDKRMSIDCDERMVKYEQSVLTRKKNSGNENRLPSDMLLYHEHGPMIDTQRNNVRSRESIESFSSDLDDLHWVGEILGVSKSTVSGMFLKAANSLTCQARITHSASIPTMTSVNSIISPTNQRCYPLNGSPWEAQFLYDTDMEYDDHHP